MPASKLQDQEISLRECIDLAVKRKRIFIALFFIAIISATVISLQMPKIYEVSMVLKVGRSLNLSNDIETKIRKEAFNAGRNVNFKVSQPQHSDLMKISLNLEEKEAKLGAQALNALFSELSDTYKEVIDNKKSAIENNISNISKRIAMKKGMLKSEIDSLQLSLDGLILARDNISDIGLFQKPEVSSLPVGPKTGQNVALAGILSLMLSGLLALFMEYSEKGRI